MSTNTKDKTTLFLCDMSSDTVKEDIESFLSQYKDKITSIQISDKKSNKATVIFKDYNWKKGFYNTRNRAYVEIFWF